MLLPAKTVGVRFREGRGRLDASLAARFSVHDDGFAAAPLGRLVLLLQPVELSLFLR
jgi:hypothetical protein